MMVMVAIDMVDDAWMMMVIDMFFDDAIMILDMADEMIDDMAHDGGWQYSDVYCDYGS